VKRWAIRRLALLLYHPTWLIATLVLTIRHAHRRTQQATGQPTATAQHKHASDATSSTTPATAANTKDARSSPACKRTTRNQATTTLRLD
jgi:hypothetical protein